MEEAEEPSITVSGHNEPLIGPKLPELSIFFIYQILHHSTAAIEVNIKDV